MSGDFAMPAKGVLIGQSFIVERLGPSPLGEAFDTEFGRTRKHHTLNLVPASAEGEKSCNDTAAYFARVSQLRHPCLVSYFAQGVDGGFEWLRSEPQTGVPESATSSAHLIVEQEHSACDDVDDDESDGPEPLDFPTLRSLLDATEGLVSADDACLIAGDISEAVDFLFDNGVSVGPLSSDAVMLDKVVHKKSMIARLRYYALEAEPPDEASIAQTAADFAALLRTLAAGAEGPRSDKVRAAFNAFAEKLEVAAKAGVPVAFHNEFCKVLKGVGAPRVPRLELLDDDSQASASVAPVQRRSKKEAPRRDPPPDGLNSAALFFLKVLALFAIPILLVLVASVLFFYTDRHGRESYIMNQTADARYSPITIVDTVSGKTYAANEMPSGIMDFTMAQLRIVAPTNPVAAMRLLVKQLETAPEQTNDIRELAAYISRHGEQFDRAAENDPVAAYWRGYSLLLGMDVGDDAPAEDFAAAHKAGLKWLEHAASKGFVEARILLGDWYAGSPFVKRGFENDRRALRHWDDAFNSSQTAWLPVHFDAAARISWFAVNNRSVKEDDPEIAKTINSVAGIRDPDAMLVAAKLYDRGVVFRRNPVAAFTLARTIANMPNRDRFKTVTLAEARYMMASAFENGHGAPQSADAARIWYERAADLGHRDAMLRLAALFEKGAAGNPPVPVDSEAAQKWRDKAAETEPFPVPPLPANPLSFRNLDDIKSSLEVAPRPAHVPVPVPRPSAPAPAPPSIPARLDPSHIPDILQPLS